MFKKRQHLSSEQYQQIKVILTDLRSYLKQNKLYIHTYSKELGMCSSSLGRYFNEYDRPSKKNFNILKNWHDEFLKEKKRRG